LAKTLWQLKHLDHGHQNTVACLWQEKTSGASQDFRGEQAYSRSELHQERGVNALKRSCDREVAASPIAAMAVSPQLPRCMLVNRQLPCWAGRVGLKSSPSEHKNL
jgi:hypothetical protein